MMNSINRSRLLVFKARGLALATALVGSWMSLTLRAAEEPLTALIPADAVAVVHVADAGGLVGELEASPLGRIWRNAKIQRFIAPAMEKLESEMSGDESGDIALEQVEKALSTFEGEALVSVVRLPFQELAEHFGEKGDDAGDEETEGEEVDPKEMADTLEIVEEGLRVIAMGRTGENGSAFLEQCRELAELLVEASDAGDGEATLVEDKLGEHELVSVRVTHPEVEKAFEIVSFAQVDGVGIIGAPRQAVEEAIGNLDKGLKGASLREGPFGTFHERNPDLDLHWYLNLESVVEVASYIMEKVEAEEAFGGQATVMGVTAEGVMGALGLDDLQSVSLGFEFDPEATGVSSGVLYRERSGLMNLLAYEKGDLPEAAFVPQGVTGASVSRFSFEGVWQAVVDMVQEVTPGMEVRQQISGMETQLGLSIEKDFLGNLKPVMINVESTTFEDAEVPQQDAVMMLALENEQGFEVALGKLLALASGLTGFAFEPSEFLGKKMHSMEIPELEPGAGPQKLSYLFADGYFIISVGKGETLRKILSSMERPGKPLWEDKQIKEAIERLPAGPSEINYMDVGSVISGLMGMLAGLLEEDESLVQWEHLPTAKEWRELIGFMVSGLWVEDDGMFSNAYLLPNEG